MHENTSMIQGHVMCFSILVGHDWKTRHCAPQLRQASYYHTSYALKLYIQAHVDGHSVNSISLFQINAIR